MVTLPAEVPVTLACITTADCTRVYAPEPPQASPATATVTEPGTAYGRPRQSEPGANVPRGLAS